MLATSSPFPQYFDLDGSPLDNGSLYFGTANGNPLTAPITVYLDSAGTQPAAQPIRTMNGFAVLNGTPVLLYVSGDYSLLVNDKRGRQVAYSPSGIAASAAQSLASDLADASNVSKGAAMVGFNVLLSYAAGTVGAALRSLFSTVAALPWANVTGKPTTVSGYGITDALRVALAAVAGLTNADVTLNSTQYGSLIITLTGTLSADINIIFPAQVGEWVVQNKTTGAFAITCKTASGSGVKAPQGVATVIFGDGTDIVGVREGIGGTGQSIASPTRALATTYTNSTGRPIFVSVTVISSGGNSGVSLSVGGAVASSGLAVPGQSAATVSSVVPDGSTYRVDVSGGSPAISAWSELR